MDGHALGRPRPTNKQPRLPPSRIYIELVCALVDPDGTVRQMDGIQRCRNHALGSSSSVFIISLRTQSWQKTSSGAAAWCNPGRHAVLVPGSWPIFNVGCQRCGHAHLHVFRHHHSTDTSLNGSVNYMQRHGRYRSPGHTVPKPSITRSWSLLGHRTWHLTSGAA